MTDQDLDSAIAATFANLEGLRIALHDAFEETVANGVFIAAVHMMFPPASMRDMAKHQIPSDRRQRIMRILHDEILEGNT